MQRLRLHLVSWNIAGRVGRVESQLRALETRHPDLVALQEVREGTAAALAEGLTRIGLVHVLENTAATRGHGRINGGLIASRWPFTRTELTDPGFPLPERLLSATIASPWGRIEIYNAHIPDGSTNGAKKIDAFVHLFKRLACSSTHPRILCGDFNSPQAELPDGQIVTWGQVQDADGSVRFWKAKRGMSGKSWDRGERLVLDILSIYDLPDIYRSLHGYGVDDFSWCVPRGNLLVRRRFDHIFAAEALRARECQYLHNWREARLSDHSAIEAIFQPDLPLV